MSMNIENQICEPRTNHGTAEQRENNEQIVSRIQAGEKEQENMTLLWQQNRNFITMIARKYSSCAEMEKADKIVEHPVYGSEDMEALKQCTLIDLEDCMTKDRETGEKGEALCMTFQNEEGKYINVSYLDGQLSISNPYRK